MRKTVFSVGPHIHIFTENSLGDDLDLLWSFLHTWLKFVAGSWMDGGATSVEVSVLKIFSSLNFTTLLLSIYLLFIIIIIFWETAFYLFDVCVLFYFTFFFYIDNVFFLFISWTRGKYLYHFFLSDNLWLEHHFYIFYYTPVTYNRYPTNISFYTGIQSERDHKNLIKINI